MNMPGCSLGLEVSNSNFPYRRPGEGNDNPLQYSCLENFMDRGAQRATVHGVTKSQTQLSMHTQQQYWLSDYKIEPRLLRYLSSTLGFPSSSDDKASACNAGDLGLIPGSGRSPGEGNGNPLQYSCLENFMDRGAQQATVHGVAESWTQLSN